MRRSALGPRPLTPTAPQEGLNTSHHEHHHQHSHERELDYAEAVEAGRREKDEVFASSPHSPVPPPQRKTFGGLSYYPVDPALRVPARFVSHEEPDVVSMPTSTGEPREYLNLGHFEFEVGDEALTLQAYWSEQSPSLFVPFRDKTSGKETYGAGRYLDVHWEGPDADYVLDFNLAYNPFCAYSEAYTCPFPPPQNWLQRPIEAGEKTFPHPE